MLWFLAGFLTAMILFGMIKSKKRKIKLNSIAMRQSGVHEILRHILPSNAQIIASKPRQSKAHKEKGVMRIIETPDKKVYWVKDNTFFYADIVDGEFDVAKAKKIDTSNLSKSELKKLFSILDSLNNYRNGLGNDSGSTGN